jgi:hypothetical protein
MRDLSIPEIDSTGEAMLGQAIAQALAAPPRERAELLERLTGEIALATAPGSGLRPWTCSVHTGTDGSRIFRGGLGYSIVVDPQGRLWRAGTVEDFATTYAITPTSCEIVAMQPKYAQMREYGPRNMESGARLDPQAHRVVDGGRLAVAPPGRLEAPPGERADERLP